jgi:methyltransferase (TIGR00027 family)
VAWLLQLMLLLSVNYNMVEPLIRDVSDTALWIAAYRAKESTRIDAAFKDPLAKKLAGQRGIDIVAATPHTDIMAFAMTVRTSAIDRLVMNAVHRSVDTIINLGAGLDTRPYRMKLPAHLQWIEVDFPTIIEYKGKLLAGDKPLCRLERVAADLSREYERRRLFASLGARTRKALVITEGVVSYLTNDQAARLSQDVFDIPSFQYWLQDYSQGRFRKNKQLKDLRKILQNTPFRLDVNDPIEFFGKQGWRVAENIFILDEAERIGRPLPVMFPWNMLARIFPKAIRSLGNRTYGYVLFGKPPIPVAQS